MQPIGTVITKKDSATLLMIISYFPSEKETGKKYDYLACVYPIGFGTDYPFDLFNEEDIQYIIHEGLEINNYDKFIKLLKEENEKNIAIGKTIVSLEEYTEL